MCQTFGQFPCRFCCADIGFCFEDHVALIHSLREIHGRQAGHRIAVHHGALNRRSAAIFRKQRAVQIDATQFRVGQHVSGQNLPVGDDNDQIRDCFLQHRLKCAVFQCFRLVDRQSSRLCSQLNRRCLHLHTAAARFIRPAHDSSDLIPLFNQILKRNRRKVRRAHIQKFQFFPD